jgi:Cof subfamily protein (haloacid dehalogenase superfamily)
MPITAELPRLIATDLDGTLLRRDGSISPRTQLTLKRARAAGIELVMVTGRPARHVATIAGAAELGGVVICVNGALIYDLDHALVVREERLSSVAARELVQVMRRELPGVCFAVEVGLDYGWEPSYGRQRQKPELPALPVGDALLLCENGVNKLIARHADVPLEYLFGRAREIAVDRATVTFSGAPFVEISSLRVSKASALAVHCAERGIDRRRVLSFGDMPNDLPMLEWAGRSVAMGNAHESVLAITGEVTLSNEEDGLAIVVERLLAEHARSVVE